MSNIVMNSRYIKPKHINFDIINYLINCNNLEYIYKHKDYVIDPDKPINNNYILEKETYRDFITRKAFGNYNIIDTDVINDIMYYHKLKHISEFYEFDIKLDNLESINNFFGLYQYDEESEIKTKNEYLEKIKRKFEEGELFECLVKIDRFDLSFVMRSSCFLLVPDIISTITPNDLYIYEKFKSSVKTMPPFTRLTLSCYYIKDIDYPRINSLKNLGEIMKTVEDKLNWINILENLRITVFEYFRINFGITDFDKIFIYTIYPEYKLNSLKFSAIYSGDFMQRVDMLFYELNLYYIDDIINYIKLSIDVERETGREINILYDIDYYYYKNNIIKTKNIKDENLAIKDNEQWDRGKILSEQNINKWKRGEILKSHIGGSVPLGIDLNTIENREYKIKLTDYIWYSIENKIDEITGFDNGYIYGYKEISDKKNYYKLRIVPKKQQNNNISDYYNLFSHYYVGYFDYGLFLIPCDEKIINKYVKVEFRDENKIILQKVDGNILFKGLLKRELDEKSIIIQDTDTYDTISKSLYNGKVPYIFSKILYNIMNDRELFLNFNGNDCLKLLKLSLITKENKSDLLYTIDFIKEEIETQHIIENGNVCKIIFMLDYTSNYNFDLDSTVNKNFITTGDYDNYFKNMFSRVFENNNIIEYVGWFLYNDIFQFKKNITDVLDTDKAYLSEIHKNIEEVFVNYFNKLGFYDITSNNIVLFYQNPSLISGLHIRVLIIKNIHKYLFARESTYDIRSRHTDSYKVIDLLKLNINFFQKYIFTYFIKEKFYHAIKSYYKKNLQHIVGGDSSNIKNNLKKFINYYINVNKNILFYELEKVKINFKIDINEKINNIKNIEKYNKFIQYRYFMKDTIGNLFRDILKILFNINIGNFIMNCLILSSNNNGSKSIENNNFLFIGKMWSNSNTNEDIKNHFYITDYNKINNFDISFSEKYFNFIHINNRSDIDIKPDVICEYFIKNIISLIWSLKHIIEDVGVIFIVIREISTQINRDLLLLLSQFSNISIYINYSLSDPTGLPIEIIIKNIKNKNILIDCLEKILNIQCKKELSFLKIDKVIKGNLYEFDNELLNISNSAFNRIFEYMETFKINKYDTNYPNISKENEELYIIKCLILFLIQHLYIKNPYEEDYYSLFEIIKKSNSKKILQIGLNNGHWTIFILTFLKFLYKDNEDYYKLICIDPYQNSVYKNIGIDNINELNLFNSIDLVNDFSYIYMEKKIKDNKNYDIIFINEYNIYDYCTIDIYNSFKLLNNNGYLIIEGIVNPKINKLLINIEKNYKNLKRINKSLKNIAVYNKIN